MAIRKATVSFCDRLAKEIEGDAAGDLFTRGRYATDASMYQCFPAGVACPKSASDVAVILEMAREEGLPIVPRGGGTSTAGQALGEGIVIDFSKYLHKIVEIDPTGRRCRVEPGCSPAALNAALEKAGLAFAVDIASARQATLGGMLGNNASGIRALRHGSMRDAALSADALLSDGQKVVFKAVTEGDTAFSPGRDRLLELLQFGEMHERAIATLWPLRAPGTPEPPGYDLRTLLASHEDQNMARLLAGAEGTLAVVTEIELKLFERSANRALGVCRFASLAAALSLVPKILLLNPSAIELMDRTLLEFLEAGTRRDPQALRLLQGSPEAILIVEFDEANPVENTRLLKSLADYVSDGGKGQFAVIEVMGENARQSLWYLRRDALMRAWTLKTAARPSAFLDDGAVPIGHLAAYGTELEALLGKYGVRTAIHGNVSRGCIAVRPVLNLRHEQDRKRMRALSEEMTALLVRHGGTLTAGYGLGIARGEAFERFLPQEARALLAQVKAQLDPANMLNPGKVLRSPRFDDVAILRSARERDAHDVSLGLAWGASPLSSGALTHAGRCGGLSLCRAVDLESACPSYAVTRSERDSPRGRANAVRLALSGQLGENALGSEAMVEAMALCVSCKACKVICPASIDIPKMKAEALHAARSLGRRSRAEDLYARLPEYADSARRWRALLALRDVLPGVAGLTERRLGIAADRPLPRWSGRRVRLPRAAEPGPMGTVALFADTFNRAFEPANLRAALNVLGAAGYAVIAFADEEGTRPLCCGRTYYDAGHIEEAKREAARIRRMVDAFSDKGVPVVGLEPACVLMMRDEYAHLGIPGSSAQPVLLFEEFMAAHAARSQAALPLKTIEADLVLHSHCHERAVGVETAAATTLKLVPGLNVASAPPGCCGLNGFAGMTPGTIGASLAMAELGLFPAIRKAGRDAFVAATGFSCRKQVHDGLGYTARHPAAILELALRGDAEIVE